MARQVYQWTDDLRGYLTTLGDLKRILTANVRAPRRILRDLIKEILCRCHRRHMIITAAPHITQGKESGRRTGTTHITLKLRDLGRLGQLHVSLEKIGGQKKRGRGAQAQWKVTDITATWRGTRTLVGAERLLTMLRSL